MSTAPPELPWRDHMKAGAGLLKWSPATFWASTCQELRAALEGLAEAQRGVVAIPPSREEVEEMMRRFGD